MAVDRPLALRIAGSHMPPMRTAVVIPELSAAISEAEYRHALAVLSGNFSEQFELPPALAQLHAMLLSTQQKPHQGDESVPAAGGEDGGVRPTAGETAAGISSQGLPTAAVGMGAATGSGGIASSVANISGLPSAARLPPERDFTKDLRTVLRALRDVCTMQVSLHGLLTQA